MDTTHHDIINLLEQKSLLYQKLIQLRKKYDTLFKNQLTSYQKETLQKEKKKEINPIKYQLEEIELQLTLTVKSFLQKKNDKPIPLPGEIWNPY